MAIATLRVQRPETTDLKRFAAVGSRFWSGEGAA